jgi:hypothetical protein
MTHYWQDNTDATAAVFNKLIKNFFPLLKTAKIVIVLRDNEKFDDEGNLIAGEARKCGTKEREVWGPDFEICLDAEIWAKYNKVNKYRLAYHELCHCGVEVEEGTNEPKYDDNNRLKTKIIKHDIWLKTFKSEIETFGFDEADHEVTVLLSELMENKDIIKKNKKRFLEKVGLEVGTAKKSSEDVPAKKKKKPVFDNDEEIPEVKKKKKKYPSEIELSTKKKKS